MVRPLRARRWGSTIMNSAVVEGVLSETLAAGTTHFLRLSTVRTGNHLKVRFWATVGEEPEVEVALV
jgi:hypothetical protein